MDHFNQLTPAEAERLALMAEECAEVIQVVGKILRHGYDSRHPAGGATNRLLLQKELGDVLASTTMLRNAGDVSGEALEQAAHAKMHSVLQWVHHQDPLAPAAPAMHIPPRTSICMTRGHHEPDLSGTCKICGIKPFCESTMPLSTAQVLAG